MNHLRVYDFCENFGSVTTRPQDALNFERVIADRVAIAERRYELMRGWLRHSDFNGSGGLLPAGLEA